MKPKLFNAFILVMRFTLCCCIGSFVFMGMLYLILGGQSKEPEIWNKTIIVIPKFIFLLSGSILVLTLLVFIFFIPKADKKEVKNNKNSFSSN